MNIYNFLFEPQVYKDFWRIHEPKIGSWEEFNCDFNDFAVTKFNTTLAIECLGIFMNLLNFNLKVNQNFDFQICISGYYSFDDSLFEYNFNGETFNNIHNPLNIDAFIVYINNIATNVRGFDGVDVVLSFKFKINNA